MYTETSERVALPTHQLRALQIAPFKSRHSARLLHMYVHGRFGPAPVLNCFYFFVIVTKRVIRMIKAESITVLKSFLHPR